MKLVLSRKGFDSSYGGMPSPILPDGTLLPLPIPSRYDTKTMADAVPDFPELDVMLRGLRGRRSKVSPSLRVHEDPVLSHKAPPPGWRPSLGQTGAAASHLRRQSVGSGDLFLFFGWFRQAERAAGGWQWAEDAEDIHVFFGWLEVDAVVPVVSGRESALERFPWLSEHPHVAGPEHYTDKRNTVYVGQERSAILPAPTVGGGRFPKYTPRLRLTAPSAGGRRSRWLLPECFFPTDGCKPLTYHSRMERWSRCPEGALLDSVARGQEFVLDADEYPGAADWALSLIRSTHDSGDSK